uniref:hypothetical protein n=1 Tax=Candidatus Electrothrix sp. TaxID=2170559 RepID=UPI0040570594
MNTKESPQKPIELSTNPAMQTILIDKIQTLIRGNDDLCLLRLFNDLPEGTFEHSRVVLTKKLLTEFLNNTCKLLNYYPEPPPKNPLH